MKTMKRMLVGSVALLVMLSVLLTSAFASTDAYTANYPSTDETYRNNYQAYQIFKGVTGGDTIGNVSWGSGVNGAAFLTALKASTAFGTPNPFASAVTADDVSRAMVDAPGSSNWVDDGAYAHAFAKLAYQYRTGVSTTVTDGITTLDKGYYLVVDEHTPTSGTGESFNLALLQLTDKGAFRIVSKASSPEVEKKVKEKEDVTGVVSDWQNAADYDTGDDVPFKLTATLGDITQYNKYFVQFNDTLNDAFTYNNDATVTLVRGSSTTDVTTYFEIVYNGTSPKTLTVNPGSSANYDVKNANIGAVKGDKLVVEYTAKFQPTLPTNDGQTGYENKVKLTYTNNPNNSSYGDGTKPSSSETDTTPEDVVKVFTYAFEINKVDETNTALPGANFKLEKFDIAYSNPAITDPADPNLHWKEIATINPVTVGTTTKFEWDGLDAGKYRFTETVTPGGYNGYNLGGTDNTPQPMEFTITSTLDQTAEPPALTAIAGTLSDTASTALNATLTSSLALLDINIQNQKGNTLPETGGAGTTMFYVTGSVLLLGGIVLLITKRRVGR